MRRITLWILTTISAVVLLLGYRTSTSSTLPTETAAAGNSSGGSSTYPAPTAQAAGTTTVTGTTEQTRWGPVQVQISVAGGKITAVQVLQVPDGNGKDREINADAVPTLVDETITAQSAKIDMVSGATYTSTGYIDSLQSALDKAGVTA
jgi:uncharacterized protein with FMN-binding domain